MARNYTNSITEACTVVAGLHKVMTFIHKSQSHDFYDFNDFIDFNNTFDFYEFYNFDGLNIYFYYDIVIYTVYIYSYINLCVSQSE